jgi:hypothetical protein
MKNPGKEAIGQKEAWKCCPTAICKNIAIPIPFLRSDMCLFIFIKSERSSGKFHKPSAGSSPIIFSLPPYHF